MSLSIKSLLEQLNSAGESVEFSTVIEVIGSHYHYQQTTFSNGGLVNQAGTNEGSCKIFAFAKLHQLSELATLNCFGKYYREDVLQNENGDDHGNIRSFIKHGWQGISFEGQALTLK